ncbi:cupin domain-containing protein [Enterococcus crotali]|uniref:cupin domain-containing protein n=1 Tax=Enterococcus crotali TaxID=1453587 RepID=UPI000472E547|nr:cupin domain-containing protein [Enterococcus crotali]
MLNNLIEIMTKNDSIFAKKEDGTNVNYYIFPEFEIHLNLVPGNTTQEWHTHQSIEEILVITDGQIRVETIADGKKSHKDCQKGDVIRMNSSLHRILNLQNIEATFAVFRFVPQGMDNREIIKNDKIEYSENEVATILNRE